jgi:amino-acid N-acetyltransferase
MSQTHDTPGNITLRPAVVGDVPEMGRLINDCAELGLMLPRSLASLYENIRDFHVAVHKSEADKCGDGGNSVVGVCALTVVWANLAEIAALVVAPQQRGHGLGRLLVESCLQTAAELGVGRIMTLTYEQKFFGRLGFEVVDRQQLPLKVWSECIRCPKNQVCDEIAMIRVLEHVPQIGAPKPQAPPMDQYIVPVTLDRSKFKAHDSTPPAASADGA